MADLFAAEAGSKTQNPGRHKSVIMIYLSGGMPHQDTFDLKPDAPAEVRGEFKPIATTVPGVEYCELLPKLASVADRCAIAPSGSHIQPVVLGADERAMDVARTLVAQGFDVRAVRPPTVPEGTARLRISLTLNAGEEATARLVDALAVILQRVPA